MKLFSYNIFLIYLLRNNKFNIYQCFNDDNRKSNIKKYPTPRWLKICNTSRKQPKYPTKRWLKICESSKNSSNYLK